MFNILFYLRVPCEQLRGHHDSLRYEDSKNGQLENSYCIPCNDLRVPAGNVPRIPHTKRMTRSPDEVEGYNA